MGLLGMKESWKNRRKKNIKFAVTKSSRDQE